MEPTTDNFSNLSPEDQKALIALPYRIGLFVSFADVTGGWEAQEKELQSLTDILRQFSQDYYKTEFTQKVLMDTLAARAAWPGWSQNIQDVPGDAARLIGVLALFLSENDVRSFCGVLADIALCVAMAYRETAGDSAATTRSPVVKDIFSRMIGARAQDDPFSHINISESEKKALQELIDALKH